MTFNFKPKGIFATAILAIGFVMTAVSCPAQGSPRVPVYIDLSGQQIPTVFWALRPDPRFASVLKREIASLQPHASPPHFQNLAFKENCPKKSLRSVSFPQTGCNGQYMEPEYRNCTLGCGGHSYRIYFSTGDFPCNGYSYGPEACNSCETQEIGCDPCQ